MPNKLIVHRLDRITLVRKGRGRAKHPELREGVVELVKAVSLPESPSVTQDYPHLGRLAVGRVPVGYSHLIKSGIPAGDALDLALWRALHT